MFPLARDARRIRYTYSRDCSEIDDGAPDVARSRTVEMAAAAGLAGVGGVAGRLILIDRAAIVEAADRLGLFVWGEDRS